MKEVTQLQHMLRCLARLDPAIPPIAADGVFGECTLEGVMVFQRDHRLPVTGVVDRRTWDALTALCLPPAPPVPEEIRDPDTLRAMARFMFNALSGPVADFTPCEAGDGTFSANVNTLRRLCRLPSGGLDRESWRALTAMFRLFVLSKRKPDPEG